MKTKLYITSIIILTSLSINVLSQGLSSVINPGPAQTNGAPDFETTKGKMISFHMLKVVDHQKVVDCLKTKIRSHVLFLMRFAKCFK